MIALGARRLRDTPMNAGNEMALPFLAQETHITANRPLKNGLESGLQNHRSPFFPRAEAPP